MMHVPESMCLTVCVGAVEMFVWSPCAVLAPSCINYAQSGKS